MQQVSSAPCTRTDVVHLEELLDTKLQQRQARETGICPVRRELYSQCFGKEEVEMLVITEVKLFTMMEDTYIAKGHKLKLVLSCIWLDFYLY